MCKSYWLLVISFVLFGCAEKQLLNLPSLLDKAQLIEPERGFHRAEVFGQSNEIYSGSFICFKNQDCISICKNLFSDSTQNDCLLLKVPQIYKINQIYTAFQSQDWFYIKDVSVFDLQVFLKLDGSPLYQLFKTLDLDFAKSFLNWAVQDWQIADIFWKEDFGFFYLELFLNKLGESPIDSLKRPLLGERTLVELSWLKQNDSFLFWINDYLSERTCQNLKEESLDACLLGQYCLLSESFQEDVSGEIIEFDTLSDLLKEKKDSMIDFKNFCSDFCLLDEGQKFCGDFSNNKGDLQ